MAKQTRIDWPGVITDLVRSGMTKANITAAIGAGRRLRGAAKQTKLVGIFGPDGRLLPHTVSAARRKHVRGAFAEDHGKRWRDLWLLGYRVRAVKPCTASTGRA